MIVGLISPHCAEMRTIQLRKLGRNFPTLPSRARLEPRDYARTSCGQFSQLPQHNYAQARRATRKPVADEVTDLNCPNSKYHIVINILIPTLSCECETPLLRKGGHPVGVAPISYVAGYRARARWPP